MNNGAHTGKYSDPQVVIAGIEALVSLPEVCIRVNEIVEDPNFSTKALGTVISQDTNLTARLLKIANSSFYGVSSKIDTITRAITIIGIRELRDLVLATMAVEAFDNIPINLANMTSFWRHSIYCGVFSKILASKCSMLHSERMFVCGLLHDIGHLVFYLKLPELEREAILNAAKNDQDIYIEETEVIGLNHACVGSALLRHWGLPESLVEPVRYHHEPELAEEFFLEAAILHTANIITKFVELGNYSFTLSNSRFNQKAIKLINLTEEDLEQIISDARPKISDALAIFLPKAS
jgi:putative nucleotidyltransferase with HDIG domain